MLVCASSVGLAVNFGAPVAAVLFGIELCGSYYRSKIYTKAIYCAVLSAFITRMLNSVVARKGKANHLKFVFELELDFVFGFFFF